MKGTWNWLLVQLEARSRWGELRTLGNSSMVRSSVLMPVFGYILIWNDKIHEYLVVRYDADTWWHQYPTWRIWFIFYGSLFVAIASLLYAWRCPTEVKRYGSAFEMADTEKTHHWYLGQYDYVFATVTEMFKERPGWLKPIYPLRDLNVPGARPHGHEQALPWLSILLTHWWNLETLANDRLELLCSYFFTSALAFYWFLLSSRLRKSLSWA